MTGLEALDTSIHKTNEWLRDVAHELELDDRHQALASLRSALHVLRDRLPAEEAAQLAAQLPIVVRGLFYEGYRPAEVPKKVRSRSEYADLVRQELATHENLAARSEEVVSAGFRVIERHVSSGETVQLRRALPREVRELWPESTPS